MQNIIKKYFRVCAVVLVFILSWVGFGLLVKSGFLLAFFTQPLTLGLFFSLVLTSLYMVCFLLRRHKAVLNDLEELSCLILKISNGDYDERKRKKSSIPVLDGINQSIYGIAAGQQRQLAELNKRTEQLDEKNLELNDAYMQLESSFGQLQATLDQLNDSEKRYHSLVVNIPDIVLTLDNMGNITYANRACRQILKFRRSDIVGEPFHYIVHSENTEAFHFEQLKQNIGKKGRQLFEILLRRKDDSMIHAEVKFTSIVESPGNESIQAIIRDVSDQKYMENTLRENNRRLEILNQFSHKMAATMELDAIYKTCVETVTDALGFLGCIYFMMDRNERFYRVISYSGEYFMETRNLEPFSYIHRNTTALSKKDRDGIVLDYESVSNHLVMNQPDTDSEEYEQAYLQELRIGGHTAGLVVVLKKTQFLTEELDILRSIGHTTAVAVENTMHLIESKNNYVKTIDALVAAIEAKDKYTRGHSQRVSSLAAKIGNRIGMAKHQIEELRIAGILHDIGKIGISDSILLKKGPLTKEEYGQIKKHPAISNKILYPIGLSDHILKAVAFHHERYDGKGYPFGLTNESLGLEPQIIAVADAFDAMTSSRPYRDALSWQEAVCELRVNKGSQFHPKIVDILIQIQKEENAKREDDRKDMKAQI